MKRQAVKLYLSPPARERLQECSERTTIDMSTLVNLLILNHLSADGMVPALPVETTPSPDRPGAGSFRAREKEQEQERKQETRHEDFRLDI